MKPFASSLAVLLSAALTTGTALAQANPGIGTWKMNVEKSKFVSMPAPKSVTRTAEAAGDAVKVSYEGEAADGSPIAYSFTCTYDGKECPDTGTGVPFGADTIALHRISENQAEATLKKGGTIVAKTTATVSADGKSMTIAYQDAKGKPTGNVAVLDKQ